MAGEVEKVIELGLQEAPNLLGYGANRSEVIANIVGRGAGGVGAGARRSARGLRPNEEIKEDGDEEKDILLL